MEGLPIFWTHMAVELIPMSLYTHTRRVLPIHFGRATVPSGLVHWVPSRGRSVCVCVYKDMGSILFVVISRHEPITLSIPPTSQGNLIKQRIIQQISRIITCRVAYHHLALF